MLWIIIIFIFNGLLEFLLFYCFDFGAETNSRHELEYLKMPSVDDLNSDDDIKKKDYISEVICPAYHYFEEKKEIDNYKFQSKDGMMPCWFVSQASIVILQMTNLLKLRFTDSRILCLLISAAICTVTGIAAKFIYKMTSIPIDKFSFSLEKLKERHEIIYEFDKFELSKENSLNNFLIESHGEYLKRIKKTIIFRANIGEILSGFAVIIYLLFFFHV